MARRRQARRRHLPAPDGPHRLVERARGSWRAREASPDASSPRCFPCSRSARSSSAGRPELAGEFRPPFASPRPSGAVSSPGGAFVALAAAGAGDSPAERSNATTRGEAIRGFTAERSTTTNGRTTLCRPCSTTSWGRTFRTCFRWRSPQLLRRLYLAVARLTGQEIAQGKLAEIDGRRDPDESAHGREVPALPGRRSPDPRVPALPSGQEGLCSRAGEDHGQGPGRSQRYLSGRAVALGIGSAGPWPSRGDARPGLIRDHNLQVHFYREFEIRQTVGLASTRSTSSPSALTARSSPSR